jgi:hypothetical protein
VNSLLTDTGKNNFQRKEQIHLEGQTLTFFLSKILSKNKFVKDLCLLIVKNNLPIQFMESIWLKHLVLRFCPKLISPFKRQFPQDILLGLAEKTNQLYVVLSLAKCYLTTSFDLWMSKGTYDVFALVINFLNNH